MGLRSQFDDVSVGSSTVQLVCVDKDGHATYEAGQIKFTGKKVSLRDSYVLSNYGLRGGWLTADRRGR